MEFNEMIKFLSILTLKELIELNAILSDEIETRCGRGENYN